MTPSKQLQQFLSNLPPKLRLQPLVPATKTTQILNQWIDKLSEIYTQNQSRPALEIKTLKHLPQPPTTYWNWIPEPIRSQEIPKLRHFTETTFQVFHPSIPSQQQLRPVNVYISSIAPPQQQQQQQEFLQRIHLAIQLLTHYSPPACHTPPLHIYIYLSPAQKTLPNLSDQILNEIHANTAFTTSCNINTIAPSSAATATTSEPHKYIILFREEEVFKVLLHELFHVLGLDFSHDSLATEKTAQFIREHFQLTLQDIRLFETYCETWASVLNCLILAFFQYSPQPPSPEQAPVPASAIEHKNRNQHIQREFLRLFSYEQTFVLFQCAKILYYHKLSYHNLTSHSKSLTKRGSRKKSQLQKRKTIKRGGKKGGYRIPQEYRENTQVFCYYILKSAVFQNIQNFLQQFPPPFSVAESNSFAQFVQKCFVHSSFEKKLHMYSALFDSSIALPDIQPLCIHPPQSNEWICQTIRQTVSEMEI